MSYDLISWRQEQPIDLALVEIYDLLGWRAWTHISWGADTDRSLGQLGGPFAAPLRFHGEPAVWQGQTAGESADAPPVPAGEGESPLGRQDLLERLTSGPRFRTRRATCPEQDRLSQAR